MVSCKIIENKFNTKDGKEVSRFFIVLPKGLMELHNLKGGDYLEIIKFNDKEIKFRVVKNG